MTIAARAETLGESASPLLILDRVTGACDAVRGVAAALGAFPPPRGVLYPGVRRPIAPADRDAAGYVRALLKAAVPYVNRLFAADGFDLLDASFSVVTTPPDRLAAPQRAPHFDSTDPDHLAILHYVSGLGASGTAFYRQRATGIERVTEANVAQFVAETTRSAAAAHGYIQDSDAGFVRIGQVEAVPDRVIAYGGSLLHSGRIPPDLPLDPDPSHGRLTGNFFVRLRRAAGSGAR